MMINKAGCVLVIYNPDYSLLKNVLDAVSSQVECVFISDNSDIPDSAFFEPWNEKVVYHNMGKNAGIAAAQNIGINYLIEKGFSHIFFLDDDSVIAKGTVDKLFKEAETLENNNVQLGGIGARPFNRQDGKKYRASINKGNEFSENITEVSELMNSASLIPSKHFLEVGMFDEKLFIDGVDHEWCWRAKSKKDLRFFIAEDILISHQLGEGDRYFVVRNVAIPSPLRTFYQFRNYFILSRRFYVPLKWKILNGFKYLVKFFYFTVFLKPGKEYFKNIVKGIKFGLLNK